jgi:hypothetical protein
VNGDFKMPGLASDEAVSADAVFAVIKLGDVH